MKERPPDALLPEFVTEDEDQVGWRSAAGGICFQAAII
jgi:hypothetical protein